MVVVCVEKVHKWRRLFSKEGGVCYDTMKSIGWR